VGDEAARTVSSPHCVASISYFRSSEPSEERYCYDVLLMSALIMKSASIYTRPTELKVLIELCKKQTVPFQTRNGVAVPPLYQTHEADATAIGLESASLCPGQGVVD